MRYQYTAVNDEGDQAFWLEADSEEDAEQSLEPDAGMIRRHRHPDGPWEYRLANSLFGLDWKPSFAEAMERVS